MRHGSAWALRRTARSRAIAIAFTVAAVAVGCAREAPDVREVRLSAERYLGALARHDLAEIRQRSTCVVSFESFQGGNVLRVMPLRVFSLATLDSLSTRAASDHRAADSLWSSASDADADSLFSLSRRHARLHILYRNALRAVSSSSPDSTFRDRALLETRTVRVRTRYAGPLVGPRLVDREQILRLLRAPGGRWIAFSLYLVPDDPRPALI